MPLDAATEFDEQVDPQPDATPAPTPAPKEPASPPAATAQQVEELQSKLDSALSELGGLKSQAEIVGKLKEVFAGKAVDPRDQYVRSELQRLVPELDDVRKIKELLPVILETLGAGAEEKAYERAAGAQDTMKGLMKSDGFDVNDDETVGYMEEALTRAIKSDATLLRQWQAGQTKAAVSKAYEKVAAKIVAPIRARTKRSAVNPAIELPKASPRGQAPSPASKQRTVDTSDTSRDGIKKIHDAAFDRLQELMDSE